MMIFNGIDLTRYFKIKDIRKSMLAPVENSLYGIPGKPGKRLGTTQLGVRYIEVDIRLKSKTKDGLNMDTRRLASMLYSEDLVKLFLPDDSGLYYMAKLDGNTDLTRILTYNDTTLSFICPDPLAYGRTRLVEVRNSTLINSGSYETSGFFTTKIESNLSHLLITLQNTGEFIRVNHNFVPGDIVTINLAGEEAEDEMVYKNGQSIMRDVHFSSDFFHLPSGEFEITSNVPTKLQFVERWL